MDLLAFLAKMQSDGRLLSVVVPMYNEEHTVGNIINRLKSVLEGTGFRYEVLVVDDFSRDRSNEIAKAQGVKVYRLNRHMGKGYALRAGFAKANGDLIATIDSDGSHLPEELPLLLLPITQGRADLVIGSRFLNNGEGTTKKINKIGNRLFNRLIQLLTGRKISDSQSGYRVMSKQVLQSVRLKSVEYEIESEMLVKATRKRFRVTEIPISYEMRTYGRSGIDPLYDGLKILLSILTAFVGS
jgi:glycosyltransferase involved in cell wall biosynthesis